MDSIQSSMDIVRNMYKDMDSTHDGIAMFGVTYHRIDPSLLWYINSKGCRSRCILAAFRDCGAYSNAQCDGPCYDNCFYSQDSVTTPDSPKTTLATWMKASLRFCDTEEYYVERTTEQWEADRRDKDQITIRTPPLQEVAINSALNSLALKKFGSLHRIFFPIQIGRRIAAVGTCRTSTESLSNETNNPAFDLKKSALSSHNDVIVLSITQVLSSIINDTQESEQDMLSNRSNDRVGLNDIAKSTIDLSTTNRISQEISSMTKYSDTPG
ncbi:hypothetical protein C7212DRAFT_342384 [Tuber magnatum]|uniref:Uncharacterized protein n=1 Tax=Tuber magnatum TaxID=42249 RepID=A0A317SUE9_9PEZI|nr:hypothetical protein C7212DRAFT_342384 [Tuber magnatum]